MYEKGDLKVMIASVKVAIDVVEISFGLWCTSSLRSTTNNKESISLSPHSDRIILLQLNHGHTIVCIALTMAHYSWTPPLRSQCTKTIAVALRLYIRVVHMQKLL